MSTYRFRTPDRTIELGEFGTAQEALEAAVDLHRAGNDADGHDGAHHDTARRDRDSAPTDGTLEVQVGGEWHPVDLEGDMA